MKTASTITWIFISTSLVLMVVGHLGTHPLNWVSMQISTYAAKAPYDYLITLSILCAAFALIMLSVLVSRYKIIGEDYLTHFFPVLLGAAAAGLIMLASYEETASTLALLKKSSFWNIRVQSFHDAGLQIFFYSSVLFIMLAGSSLIFTQPGLGTKVIALIIFSLGPASFLIMTTGLPYTEDIGGATHGLNQRAALFCLWLAVVLIMVASSQQLTASRIVSRD